MRKILANSTWRLPYIIFFSLTVFFLTTLLVAVYFNLDIAAWDVPDALRLNSILPILLGAIGGMFGFVPGEYLHKNKKANIFYFVNSRSFRAFIAFWVFCLIIQVFFYFMPTIQLPYELWTVFDISQTAAGLVMLLLVFLLLMRLFTTKKQIGERRNE